MDHSTTVKYYFNVPTFRIKSICEGIYRIQIPLLISYNNVVVVPIQLHTNGWNYIYINIYNIYVNKKVTIHTNVATNR